MVHLSVVYGQSQLLGFGTSLNSIVAASTQYSFHLPIFQLPERTHCKAPIVVDTSVRNILSLAQTPLGFNTTASAGYLLQQEISRQNSQLWEVIQHLSSNSLKRFQMEKRSRSHEFGLHGCYFVRKLAANLGEPQRSYALNAIDRAIRFWKGKGSPNEYPCGLHGYSLQPGPRIYANC